MKKNSSGVILSIKNLCGRKTDLIYRTNGTPIDLFNSISPQIYNNPLVRQWQFIQNGPKNYILRICSEKKEIQEERMNFTQSLKQILGDDAIVEIETPHTPRSNTIVNIKSNTIFTNAIIIVKNIVAFESPVARSI